MAEMESQDVADPVSPGEAMESGSRPADPEGLLKHSREFLDFFWDIAKPEQETRLQATKNLLQYLRTRPEVWWQGLGQGAVWISPKMWRWAPGIGTRGTGSPTWLPR